MKRALITGISGQDGSFMAELLLEKGYEVVGIVRKDVIDNSERLVNICNIIDDVELISGDITDYYTISNIFANKKIDECYHFAADSFVGLQEEIETLHVNVNSSYNVLQAIKTFKPDCKLYIAGSSEMFGNVDVAPQNEYTKFNPRSIYGVSKVNCYHLMNMYRQKYELFACMGFAYNHESYRRRPNFLFRKISRGVSEIKQNKRRFIEVGNIEAERDWGYAPEYVQAMWLMLNQEKCSDYVLSTGKINKVKDVLQKAFAVVGLDYREYIVIAEKHKRFTENVPLVGDNSRIFSELGWQPNRKLDDIIIEMVNYDLSNKLIGDYL